MDVKALEDMEVHKEFINEPMFHRNFSWLNTMSFQVTKVAWSDYHFF